MELKLQLFDYLFFASIFEFIEVIMFFFWYW